MSYKLEGEREREKIPADRRVTNDKSTYTCLQYQFENKSVTESKVLTRTVIFLHKID